MTGDVSTSLEDWHDMAEHIVQWTKACDCRGATATTGRIVLSDATPNGEKFTMTATLHPGPVCDKCDTPWRREP